MERIRSRWMVSLVVTPFLLALPGQSVAGEVCGEIENEDFGDFIGFQCARDQGKGTVRVSDQAELDAYLVDFAFDGRRVKNLKVEFNPTGEIDIFSPCHVAIFGENDFLDIAATSMRVFGRLGVSIADDHDNSGEGIVVDESITIVSTEGHAGFSAGLQLEANQICVQAAATAKVGEASDVDAIEIDLISTGKTPHSDALIRENSFVTADRVGLAAWREASIGMLATLEVGDLSVTSTGIGGGSVAAIHQGAEITADRVGLVARREASIGMLATLEVGDLSVTSTGIGRASVAAVHQGAEIKADTFSLTSANKATLGPHSSVDVLDTFKMEAADPNKCKISKSASVTASVTVGNCLTLHGKVDSMEEASLSPGVHDDEKEEDSKMGSWMSSKLKSDNW